LNCLKQLVRIKGLIQARLKAGTNHVIWICCARKDSHRDDGQAANVSWFKRANVSQKLKAIPFWQINIR